MIYGGVALFDGAFQMTSTNKVNGHVAQLLADFVCGGAMARHPTSFIGEREFGSRYC